MNIINVSETLSGRPMVEIDTEPLDASGTLDTSEELADLLKPYLIETDNIAVRFMGQGLPTTVTAVVSELYAKLDDTTVIWYEFRCMLFETGTGLTGCNAHFKPVRRELICMGVEQAIPDGRDYNFKEVYGQMEDAANDTERLLSLAHEHFISK